jgi:hypothetical protein
MLRRLSCAMGIVAVLIAIVALEVSLLTPYYGEICSKAANTNQENCARYNLVLVVLCHIAEALNYISPALTAIATAVVGAFTYTLWRATSSQARVAQQTIDLARDEFLAAHRPELVVHSVRLLDPRAQSSDPLAVQFGIINAGTSAAMIGAVRSPSGTGRRISFLTCQNSLETT